MAVYSTYFLHIKPQQLECKQSISIGLYSETSKTTTVTNHPGGGYFSVLMLALSLKRSSKGFCEVKKISKIREKLRSGWVGQAPTRIIIIILFFFVCFLCCFHVSKKNVYGGGWVASGQSEFFSDFWILFNLTRPLSVKYTIKVTINLC